jgi:hypothetical protein
LGKAALVGRVEAEVFNTFVTPGDRKIRLAGSRPFRGSWVIEAWSTTLLISALVVLSKRGSLAVLTIS